MAVGPNAAVDGGALGLESGDELVIGLWQIVIMLAIAGVFAFFVWLYVRICHKAGRSGWWSLLIFVPLVNFAIIWVFAFARWPNVDPAPAAPGETASDDNSRGS